MAYEYQEFIKEKVSRTASFVSDRVYNELQEVYEKAKAFDELVKLYPQKDEIPSDEFFDEMKLIIKEDE